MLSPQLPERLDLAMLTAEQLQPLEALFTPEWPDTWRDFGRSLYVSLLSEQDAQPPAECADRAVRLVLGIAQDEGGTQPYIPIGNMLAISARGRLVIDMLKRGRSYRDVAAACSLTESRVRRIEAEWRKADIASRQGALLLE